ncbi:unnamed protein product [Paramecium pentaurelia]|uniref:Uncharacterized protein n=1 Tax=Paramecium pentaurelia TaxID=43138 RepID=A0A8S1U6A4_9CILI|nr:unnamed protein product [Paramecium pentaurelia]
MLNSKIYLSPNTTKNTNSSQLVSQIYGSQNSSTRAYIEEIRFRHSQLQINDQYSLKKEVYEEKLNQIDEKFQNAYKNDIQRITSLQNQLNKIGEMLTNEQNIRNNNNDNFRKKDLKQLESHVKNELMKDKIKRTDNQVKITKQIDVQSHKIKMQLLRQRQYRQETETQYSNDIKNKIDELRENVDNERRERDVYCQNIIGRIGEQVLSVQETINMEKQQRQESQNQMQMMIQEITNILSLQLAEEKQQREETERTIIRLINETCNRVENSIKK